LVLAVAAVVAVAAALAAIALGRGLAGTGSYQQRNLVSDVAGKAELKDADLVNGWGLALGPQTFAWVANNGSNTSTLYAGGVSGSPVTKVPLTVSIPGGAPTGMVYNGSNGFMVSGGPALFIFDSEAGRITAWSQTQPNLSTAQTVAKVHGAIFKGLAISNADGGRLYATDFHHGKIDTWDSSFMPVKAKFRDPGLPKGYAPFGIQAIGSRVVVTYAKQDKKAEDEVAGKGKGFVDVYTTSGKLVRRLISRGALNAPWGIAPAPKSFGAAGGDLLVGNFGDGRINAYSAKKGKTVGALAGTNGKPIRIDGLWGLAFGNGIAGSADSLLFTAGPGDESHGLYGELTPSG
jgi:uncharacterized protein (TIGR03118 family)